VGKGFFFKTLVLLQDAKKSKHKKNLMSSIKKNKMIKIILISGYSEINTAIAT
jgi:hypothetical protein